MDDEFIVDVHTAATLSFDSSYSFRDVTTVTSTSDRIVYV